MSCGPRGRRSSVAAVLALGLPGLGLGLSGCGASGSPPPTLATYAPAPATGPANLHKDATILLERLRAWGDGSARVGLRRGSIVVSGTGKLPATAATLAETGILDLRPVLCAASAYRPGPTAPAVLPTCGSAYLLDARNENVDTNTGQTVNDVAPDPAFADVPSTSPAKDTADATVLLPVPPGELSPSYARLVLGPAGVTDSAVTGAQSTHQTSQWVVNLSLSSSGSASWDRLADEQFHAFVAMVLDGDVLSVSLVLPNAAVFTSFGGRVQFSGNFTRTTARALAIALRYGPLPAPLHAAR